MPAWFRRVKLVVEGMPGCLHVSGTAAMGPALLVVTGVSPQGCKEHLKTARWSSLGSLWQQAAHRGQQV